MTASEPRCERHPNSIMVLDCYQCRQAIRAARAAETAAGGGPRG